MADDNLIRALRNITKNNEEVYCKLATVITVDKGSKTCVVSPIDGSPDFFDVRLQCFESPGSGVVVYPKTDSIVIIGFLSKEETMILQVSEVDRVTIENEGESLKIILSDLVKKLEDLTEKVTQITVMTAVGVSGMPLNQAEILQVKQELEALNNRLPKLFE